jgi:hypothetical protein
MGAQLMQPVQPSSQNVLGFSRHFLQKEAWLREASATGIGSPHSMQRYGMKPELLSNSGQSFGAWPQQG